MHTISLLLYSIFAYVRCVQANVKFTYECIDTRYLSTYVRCWDDHFAPSFGQSARKPDGARLRPLIWEFMRMMMDVV